MVGLDSETDDVGLDSDTDDGTSTTIGIVVGSILAALCIVAALLLILRHRQRRQQAGEPRSQQQKEQQQQREVSHYSFLPTNQSQSAEAWSNHSTKGSNAGYTSVNIQPRATQYESGNMESAGTLSSVNPDSSKHH